ncbi:hypothetical protein HDU92_008659 [Lobulomyces angularis]|nr:hypothetical protein HDU92_008659 [Lobulomyces angularis]
MKYNLVVADEKQLKLIDTYEAWGLSRNLTRSQYENQERNLSKTSFFKYQTQYVLIEHSKPFEILSSCETYERSCSISTATGELVNGRCFSIASVFTPPNHRGKGFASEMMKLLFNILKNKGALASNLNSDVGRLFYAKFGWKFFESKNLILPKQALLKWIKFRVELKKVTLDNLKTVLRFFNLNAIKHHKVKKNIFFVDPKESFESLEWIYLDTKFLAKVLLNLDMDHFGVFLQETGEFFLWTLEIEKKKLVVHLVNCWSQNSLKKLMVGCLDEVERLQMDVISFWNPNLEIFDDVINLGEYSDREKSLSCLAILSDDFKGDVEWVYNEKYLWV